MRNKIPALVADITLASTKTQYWIAQAKCIAATKGMTSEEYRAATRLASTWSHDLEALQEELEAETDSEEIAFNSEYASVD